MMILNLSLAGGRRRKATTKAACQRGGRTYRKGFTKKDGTRVKATCAKKRVRRRKAG